MKVYTSTAATGVTGSSNRGAVSKDGFLKILSAQLQNQDPLNAKDNSEYVAQMAQFSALEQMQNLNTSMNNLILSQKVNEANIMIGKLVTVYTEEGEIISGEVTAARAAKGSVNIVVDGKNYDVDSVIEVKKNESSIEQTEGGSGQSVV